MWISRFISIQLDESARRLECGNARRCSVLAGNAGSQHVNFAQRALPARRLKCGVALSRSQSLTVAHSRSQNSHTQVIVRSERKQRRERKDNFVSFRKNNVL